MKKANIIIDGNGKTCTTNFMLDDVIDLFEKYSIDNDALILELTIQKIEYGRMCLSQGLNRPNNSKEKKLDDALCLRIIELGGKPIEIATINKS